MASIHRANTKEINFIWRKCNPPFRIGYPGNLKQIHSFSNAFFLHKKT